MRHQLFARSIILSVLSWGALLVVSSGCKTQGFSNSHELDAELKAGQPSPAGMLGINDVTVLIPSDAWSSTPALADITEPKKFAPGVKALPGEGSSILDEDLTQLLDETLGLQDCMHGPCEMMHKISHHAAHIHLSSMRIDPCFNLLQIQGDRGRCQAQLRFTWQRRGERLGDREQDENVHTIFNVNTAEFQDILQTIIAAQKTAGFSYQNEALQAHPVIVKQGVQGPYFKSIIGLVHRYARRDHLLMVTAMVHDYGGVNPNWFMAGIRQDNGVFKSLKLQGLRPEDAEKSHQSLFFNDVAFGAAVPPAAYPDNFVPLFADGRVSFEGDNVVGKPNFSLDDKKELSAKLSKIDRVNNPLIHDLNTLDCTSCHQATAAEAAVNVLAPDVKADDAKARYTSRFNLSNEVTRALFDPRKPERPHFVLQMLSYRGAPIIQTRVVNESALVLEQIQTYEKP